MNYDFNNDEFESFARIQEIMESFAKGRDLDEAGEDEIQENTMGALNALAGSSFLNFGLEQEVSMVPWMGAMEIVSSISPSIALSIEMSRVFCRIIEKWAKPGDKAGLLEPVLQGRAVGTVAVSEDSMNVENPPFATHGRLSGGRAIINGHKNYVVNAPFADWIAVFGTLEDRCAIFLVEKGSRGLEIKERFDTLGFRGASISRLNLEDCEIPESGIIGPFDEYSQVMGLVRMWENQALIGMSLGLGKASFQAARDYAKAHKSGRKPIIAFQEVGFKLAEMLTLFQTSQLFAYRAAGENSKEAEILTLCAKVFCTEAAEQITSSALQILGGAGFIEGNPAELGFRCVKYCQAAGTSTEIARMKIGNKALGAR